MEAYERHVNPKKKSIENQQTQWNIRKANVSLVSSVAWESQMLMKAYKIKLQPWKINLILQNSMAAQRSQRKAGNINENLEQSKEAL